MSLNRILFVRKCICFVKNNRAHPIPFQIKFWSYQNFR